MKKYIALLLMINTTILLSGCYQNNKTNETQNTSNQITLNSSGYLEPKSENEVLKGLVISGASISGFFYPIIISGNNINYSGLVNFIIPNTFNKWEYYRNPQIISTHDGLSFSSEDQKILTIETTLVDTGDTTETICKRTNYGGRVSKQEKKIKINGQEIKITKQTFMTSGEGVKPQKAKQTNICFVRDNISYDIRWSNVNIDENIILNSITFAK